MNTRSGYLTLPFPSKFRVTLNHQELESSDGASRRCVTSKPRDAIDSKNTETIRSEIFSARCRSPRHWHSIEPTLTGYLEKTDARAGSTPCVSLSLSMVAPRDVVVSKIVRLWAWHLGSLGLCHMCQRHGCGILIKRRRSKLAVEFRERKREEAHVRNPHRCTIYLIGKQWDISRELTTITMLEEIIERCSDLQTSKDSSKAMRSAVQPLPTYPLSLRLHSVYKDGKLSACVPIGSNTLIPCS